MMNINWNQKLIFVFILFHHFSQDEPTQKDKETLLVDWKIISHTVVVKWDSSVFNPSPVNCSTVKNCPSSTVLAVQLGLYFCERALEQILISPIWWWFRDSSSPSDPPNPKGTTVGESVFFHTFSYWFKRWLHQHVAQTKQIHTIIHSGTTTSSPSFQACIVWVKHSKQLCGYGINVDKQSICRGKRKR